MYKNTDIIFTQYYLNWFYFYIQDKAQRWVPPNVHNILNLECLYKSFSLFHLFFNPGKRFYYGAPR